MKEYKVLLLRTGAEEIEHWCAAVYIGLATEGRKGGESEGCA